MNITEIRERRRQLVIPPEVIEQLIDLPEGARVFGIRGGWEPPGIIVTVVDERFAPVDPMCEAPLLNARQAYDRETGRLSVSYDVEAERT